MDDSPFQVNRCVRHQNVLELGSNTVPPGASRDPTQIIFLSSSGLGSPLNNDRDWHYPDLQHPRRVGLQSGALLPLGVEGQFSGAFRTRCHGAL
jgi:hypothetical protein